MVGQVVASAGAGSRAVSIPGRDPWCSVTFDAAKAACVNKGSGWHLMTNWEWAALVLWCLKNGYQPRGNTNYGRAHDALHETAPRQDGLAPIATVEDPVADALGHGADGFDCGVGNGA